LHTLLFTHRDKDKHVKIVTKWGKSAIVRLWKGGGQYGTEDVR
jgi:hypothetical protein